MAGTHSLPAVPVKHQDFVNYIQSHPDTPIEDLIQSYNDYDAVARRIFAQEPSHPAVQDNHFNLVPLYDDAGSNRSPVRARNLDSEPPELKEKYILPLKDQDRRPNGSPAVVPSFEEFQKNFTLFSEGALSDLDWSNVVVAGSAVVTSVLPVPEKYRDSKRALRQYYHEKFAPASDVDLFLYGLTDEQAIEKIKQIEFKIKNTVLAETTTVRTKNTITIASQYPTRHVQIVLRIYRSISEILTGFDVDCSCAAYDGKQIYVSPRALASYITQINRIDMTRRSPSYENRLSKYSHRGFEVYWPPLDRSKIDPTIFERSFTRTVGLARLLVLEKLPKSDDRERYLAQRRAERGRPLTNPYARRPRQLWGNIKEQWDDEAPEWQEEDELSDYHTFSIPYGPRYHARRIEKLLYTKDLLLNAEWNKSKERKVHLHRHPAFFGDAEDVIHDCCGYCPEPVTEEDKEVAEQESKTYISGDVTFIKDDPGRQEIGSFNPITDTDWTEMAYVGNTERLCHAIANHDVEAVKQWLSQENADPNSRDYTGRTPLHLASLTSTPEIVQCLVDHGARLISRVADGRTALHFAAARGAVGVVRILLKKSEQNEEQEAKKEDQKKSAESGKKVISENVEDEDSDIELVDADDSGSRTSGSYVKVDSKEADENAFDEVPGEGELEPDIYDINALSWDSHTSPLHLAILNGQVEVVQELVTSFGADVLLPIKLHTDTSSSTAILTLVLALQLAPGEAKAITQKLLELGASPAQADLDHNTALHYLAASKHADLLDIYIHHDEPAVKRAINHLAFAGKKSCIVEPYSALVAAVNAKNVPGALKMLEAGADTSLDYGHFVKSGKAVSDRIQRNDPEDNQQLFRHRLAQPIIQAVNNELPSVVIGLLERGADPNTLTPEGYQEEDDEDAQEYVSGQSTLDLVREKIKSLRGYKGEQEWVSSPLGPLNPDDNFYFGGIEEGSYALWTAKHQLKEARRKNAESRGNYEDDVCKKDNRPGLDQKLAAAKELAEEFQRVEGILLEKGAKTFAELHPNLKEPEKTPYTPDEEEERKDRFRVTFSFKVPDLTNTKRKGYLEIFNAAWHGDLTTIKALTLAMWGPQNEETPLQIAVTDSHGFSPFAIAALRGHLNLAKAILEIVQVQYKPEEEKGQRRYRLDEDNEDEDHELPVYSEIVDDQFTVENIGEVATQVECPITPLQVLSWDCPAFFLSEDDGMSDEEKHDILDQITSIYYMSPRRLRYQQEVPRIPQSLGEFAIWTDNVDLLVFLLELGQELTNRNTAIQTTIYTVSENMLRMAIILGRVHCLEELIKRTGAGLPIDQLVHRSGVKSTEKPIYYQGLSIRGKKRADWTGSGGGSPWSGYSNGPPLLSAAVYGKLDATKWFLGKEPSQHYLTFTKTYEHDKRLRHLEQSAKGLEGTVLHWVGLRNELVLHCAVMSRPTKESGALVEYLAKHNPTCLETKNLDGLTPLALAYSLHRTSFARILIDAGADQTTRDKKGNNLVHLLLCDFKGQARDKPDNMDTLLSLLDPSLVLSLTTERSSDQPGSLSPLARWLHTGYTIAIYDTWEVWGSNSNENIETNEKVAIVRLILDFAQSTGQKHLEMLDGAGNAPVHDAVKGQLPRALELMIKRRPELLHRESATGNTPLEMAADAWVNKVTSCPPKIPDSTASSSWGSNPLCQGVLQRTPESFTCDWDTEARDVQQVTYNLCRQHVATTGPTTAGKRKLVTLFEANEVAKRLAAYNSTSRESERDSSNDSQEAESDEVQLWYNFWRSEQDCSDWVR